MHEPTDRQVKNYLKALLADSTEQAYDAGLRDTSSYRVDELLSTNKRELRAFSLTAAIAQALDSGLHGTIECELLKTCTELAGRQFTPHDFVIPWQLLRRDLSAAGGGYPLVGLSTTDPVEILRPFSLAARLGVQFLPSQRENLLIPKISGSCTAYWLADELSPVTGSQPTVGAISSTPKTCGAVITYSHQIRRQATPEGMLQQHLLATAAQALDRAVLQGSGVSGEPAGLSVISGTESTTGTSLGLAGVAEMLRKSSAANAEPSAFVTTPAVRELLMQRAKASGSDMIWNGNEMAGLPAYATTAAPTATLFLGPWDSIAVPIWGPGPMISINPATYFSTGRYQIRVLLQADVVVRHPEAFVISASIT